MDLYVIRHAEAVARGSTDLDDAARPLTPAGHDECEKLASALTRQDVRLDCIVTSPLLRARQTAEGLLKNLPAPTPHLHTCDHLEPGGRRRKLTRFLRGLKAQSVAVIGHEPDLHLYVAWLIGSKKAQLDVAKSGFACIHFDEEPDGGEGVLTWLVTPQWY